MEDVIVSDEDCHSLLRMNVEPFMRFVHLMKGTNRLHDTIHCKIQEQVAIFLHIIAHNLKNQNLKFYFKRSGETISRYLNAVLEAIIDMEDDFMKSPSQDTLSKIRERRQWWPFFKDCVGAIEGTHILVKVTNDVVIRFFGRKHMPTQNVLAACSFDLKFIYVFVGWEGSASDSWILSLALSKRHGLKCPKGKYYLADAGYPIRKQIITPFRKHPYLLNDIRG